MHNKSILRENNNPCLGGPNTTVELDERFSFFYTSLMNLYNIIQFSMFGKRKFHRGTVQGRRMLWVLGGICR